MSERAYQFRWDHLGDIAAGRPNLGAVTYLAVYRLMQYSLRHILACRYGEETVSEILNEAGHVAGSEFCRNVLDTSKDFNGFIAQVQERLRELHIGILRMEKADLERQEFVLTLAEDLDCSGLPVTDETVCQYDEGFLAGIFSVYTGKKFMAREIDCWANGERTCRFVVNQIG
jgi:predicted hydrocarbon binding protein